MTIHFVYAFDDTKVAQPYSIGNETAKRLAPLYPLQRHSVFDRYRIRPRAGDILIGLPLYGHCTCFERSLDDRRWARKIMLSPYCPGMPQHVVFFDECIDRVDAFLAITGRYWFDRTAEAIYSHWLSKMTQVDLAVNQAHFPFFKRRFNAPGQRKFLYIGHTASYKNPQYLAALADANPDLTIGHIGLGQIASQRVVRHGVLDFKDPAAQQIVADYDFLLTVGQADANPTTILEAGSWGLVPVCTRESGYYECDWLFNVPLDDVNGASAVLQRLNQTDSDCLMECQAAAQRALAEHFNWDRFGRQVIAAIDGPLPRGGAEDPRAAANRAEIRSYYHFHRNERRKVKLQRLKRWTSHPLQACATIYRRLRGAHRIG